VPKKSQFRAKSAEQVHWKLMNDYPAGTRMVKAEKVTEGGIFGFFATTYYEVSVEIPSMERPAGVGGQPAPPAAGVAALLMEADMEEARLRRGAPRVSTDTADFEDLMTGIADAVRAGDQPSVVVPVDEEVPALLDAPGKVVLVAGLGQDALTAARSLASSLSAAEIRTAGSAMMSGFVHVVGSKGLEDAKAAGRQAGRVVIVAFGIGRDGNVRVPALSELTADQVWLAVDATKKSSDTAAWVRKVIWVMAPDALVVMGAHDTLTPQTVNELEVPVGWVDGQRALSPSLY
jgi:hypothetical protein